MARRGKRMMHNAKDVITALGGPTAVANWLGLDQSTVSGWGLRDAVGRGYRFHIYWSLRDRGYTEKQIPAKAFGLSSWDDVIMPKLRRSKAKKAA